MSQAIRLSVILPVRNGERHLEQALQSVSRNCTAQDELIVVNDQSTDGTDDILQAFRPEFPVKLITGLGQGPAQARNLGLKAARSSYITFLDHDDYWPDDRIESHLQVFEVNQGVDVVTGKTQYVDEERGSGRRVTEVQPSEVQPNEVQANKVRLDASPGDQAPGAQLSGRLAADAAVAALFHVHLGGSTFRRDVFEVVGYFDEQLSFSEDHDLFLRIREAGLNIHPLDATSLYYLRHQTNMTRDKRMGEMQLIRVIQKSLARRRQKATVMSPFPKAAVSAGVGAPLKTEAQITSSAEPSATQIKIPTDVPTNVVTYTSSGTTSTATETSLVTTKTINNTTAAK